MPFLSHLFTDIPLKKKSKMKKASSHSFIYGLSFCLIVFAGPGQATEDTKTPSKNVNNELSLSPGKAMDHKIPPDQNKKTTEMKQAANQKALSHLQMVLQKYQSKNIYMKVTKTSHIAAIGKQTSETGDLYLRSGRFRLSIQGEPASLMIFDGSFLWYQPDRAEKVVLKFKNHPQIGLFASLFDYKSFFKFFLVTPMKLKRKNHYIYVLELKNPTDAISKMILSCGKNINAVKILWQELGNWQSYVFSKLWFRKHMLKNLFVFNTKDFEVVEPEATSF